MSEKRVELAVLRCPSCNNRHGGYISDTKLVSWKCKRCKWHNVGEVREGEFLLLSHTFECVDLQEIYRPKRNPDLQKTPKYGKMI